jgi:hypothetical protein
MAGLFDMLHRVVQLRTVLWGKVVEIKWNSGTKGNISVMNLRGHI